MTFFSSKIRIRDPVLFLFTPIWISLFSLKGIILSSKFENEKLTFFPIIKHINCSLISVISSQINGISFLGSIIKGNGPFVSSVSYIFIF